MQSPIDPSETRRIERWLATARVFLAISTLAAIYMDPTQLGQSPVAYGLLGLYLIHGVLVITLLRRRKESTPAFRLLVHVADIVWPAVISVFAEEARSPFFLFFFFVLAAAAYRWGLWETLSTAAAEVALLWIESFLFLHVWTPKGALPWRALAGLNVNLTQFEPKRLFMLSVYLLVMGLLLGYLAGQQKKLRAEKAVVTGLLAKVRVEAGLTGTLAQMGQEILGMYRATRVLVASQEIHSHRTFLGELQDGSGAATEFVWLDSNPRDAKVYLEGFPGEALYAAQERNAKWLEVALDREGNQIASASTDALVRLRERQEFHSLFAISFVFGSDWRGRVFVFDPSWQGRPAGRTAIFAGPVPPGGSGGV